MRQVCRRKHTLLEDSCPNNFYNTKKKIQLQIDLHKTPFKNELTLLSGLQSVEYSLYSLVDADLWIPSRGQIDLFKYYSHSNGWHEKHPENTYETAWENTVNAIP